jgi:hypothetical protein
MMTVWNSSLGHPNLKGGWPSESASKPLMGFGELNDNIIKELMILLKLS